MQQHTRNRVIRIVALSAMVSIVGRVREISTEHAALQTAGNHSFGHLTHHIGQIISARKDREDSLVFS